ncbi:MAG: rhodanese-like domain-containing protein [bacterium]|nr:rhodanese-like domain-containing protein [bacterium]
MRYMLQLVLIAVVALVGTASANDGFPYRVDYADCNVIETHELGDRLAMDDIVVVDVRSQIEYDVIHVNGALHSPVAKKTFAAEVQKIAAANAGKAIAFYCNGRTCLKSYKAVRAAQAAGLENCLAYDAGIPEWANTFPDRTLLLGEKVTDPQRQIIPKSDFKARCLTWTEFRHQTASETAMVIDVREPVQRGDRLPDIGNPRTIPLDVFIPNFVAKNEGKDRTLYIYDQVGKQVRWLMYYLEERGYEDYWFLGGGVLGVLKEQNYRS